MYWSLDWPKEKKMKKEREERWVSDRVHGVSEETVLIVFVSNNASHGRSGMKAQFHSKGHFANLVDQFLRLFGQFQGQSSDDFHLIQAQRILHFRPSLVESLVQHRTSRTRIRLTHEHREKDSTVRISP